MAKVLSHSYQLFLEIDPFYALSALYNDEFMEYTHHDDHFMPHSFINKTKLSNFCTMV